MNVIVNLGVVKKRVVSVVFVVIALNVRRLKKMSERELAKTIMEERLRDGLEIVEKLAKETFKDVNTSPDIQEKFFIKGIEVGVSLFIQKEQTRRFKKPIEKKEPEKRLPNEKQIGWIRKNTPMKEIDIGELSFEEAHVIIGEGKK